MNITTDPNLWAICALVFLLGLIIGIFLTAGGRRKWRERYNSEVNGAKKSRPSATAGPRSGTSAKRSGASAIQPARRRGQESAATTARP